MNTLQRGRDFCLDILFPRHCLGCRKEGDYICRTCRQQLPPYGGSCFGCRTPVLGGRLCDDCQSRYAFDGLIIAAEYENELASGLIKACKYRFVEELADVLGELCALGIERRWLAKAGEVSALKQDFFNAVVMPVPLSRRRQRWRGFNQSEGMARRLAAYFALPISQNLIRIRHRPPQAKLAEAQRQKNLAGCFSLEGKAPPLVFLVDDVVTTGATLNECAKILRAAGAEEVWGIVAAKG